MVDTQASYVPSSVFVHISLLSNILKQNRGDKEWFKYYKINLCNVPKFWKLNFMVLGNGGLYQCFPLKIKNLMLLVGL